ncbi:MAG: DNA translocase FtsK [Bacteroidales bacterium]|nr:DNA translocase FtsK [Bacteroidales bacterium]
MTETEKKKKRGRPPKKNTPEKQKKTLKSILNDEKFKFLFGIFLLFFTVYSLIAFISFLFTWQLDGHMLDMSFFQILKQEKPANSMGKLGAYLSKLFIYKWFGVSAFGFIVIFPLWALKLFKVKIKNFTEFIGKTLFLIIWSSLFLAFIFGDKFFNLGGSYGYSIIKWTSSIIGKFGAGFLLFISALTFVFFAIENSFEWTKTFFKNLSQLKNFKKAYSKTKASVSFFNSKEKRDVDLNNDENNIVEKDISDLIASGDENLSKNLADAQKAVERQEFILGLDGTRTPLNKNKNEEVGFEISQSMNQEETVDIENEDDNQLENQQNTELFPAVNNNSEVDTSEGLEVLTHEDILTDQMDLEEYDPTKTLSNYKLPPLSLLKNHTSENSEVSENELIENRNKIVETLRNYKIEITKIKATVGPTITLYEIIPAPGVRISKIKNLEDDIALSLSALGIRIIAPMPGRGTIGIEVPNQNPAIVSMKSVLSSVKFQKSKHELPIALGKTISNETYVFDLTKMPHMLVAGATGQGKSVGINAIIASILYKKHPAYVKFVLIDPKKVELNLYEVIEKHFLAKLPDDEEAIITDNSKVVATLNSLNVEMDNRYQLLKDARVRNIMEYNEKFVARKLNPHHGHNFMPYIVLVIDEFADLIMTAGKEVELPLARLAQLARAIGIHLIVATQRPSTNIITGVIKANFPARVAFRVASMIDSRTILDSPGANQLVGRGDLLMTRGSDLIRLQCAFIDTPELNDIVEYISQQQAYSSAFDLPEPQLDEDGLMKDVDLKKRDSLFEDAARLIVVNQQGSTSLIQRKLAIGYNRAGRIMDQLEAAGIVGPAQGSKPREVYMYDEMTLHNLFDSLNKME